MADAEFTDWCTSNGIVFNGITAAFVSEGWRGIIATKDLQPGEVVLRVPERLLLTTRSAARDPQLAAALQRHRARTGIQNRGGALRNDGPDGLSPLQILACHLLLEVSRGPDSFWWPYLSQLPRSYSSLANFSPEDAAALQLQHACDVAAAAAERAREEWRAALPVLQDLGLPKRFTVLRAWLWATSTLHSRTMYLPWCPAGALTPYGDLHNYQPPPAPYTPQLGPPAAVCHDTAAPGGRRRSNGSPGGPQGQKSGKGSQAESGISVPRLDGGPGPQLHQGRLEISEAARSSGTASDSARHYRGPESRSSPCDVRTEGPSACDGAADGPGIPTTTAASRGANRPALSPPLPAAAADSVGAEAAAAMSALTAATSVATVSLAASAATLADLSVLDRCHQGDAAACAARSAGAAAAGEPSPELAAAAGLPADREDNDGSPLDSSSGPGHQEADSDRCQGREVGAAGDITPATHSSGAEGSGDDWSTAIAGDGLWDEPAQQYHIVVRRPYVQGEQVMLCYGRYTNLELLEHYGFVLQDNPHDTALLDPEMLPLGPPGVRTATGMPYLAPADCFLHANGQPSWQLLHYLRYAAASPSERRAAGHLMAAGERVSEQGDRQALQWLHAACIRQLAVLPTLLGQDLDMQLRQQGQLLHRPAQLEPGQVPPPPRSTQSPEQPQQESMRSPRLEVAASGVEIRTWGPRMGSVHASLASPTASPSAGTPARAAEVAAAASSSPPPSAAAAAAVAATAAAAFSDGLTCAGLALQWRIAQKQILHRAMQCAAEQVLGPGASSWPCKPVPARDLHALIQEQRQRRHGMAASR